MASTSETVTITQVQTLTLPDEISDIETGTYFLGDLPVPPDCDYSSAALIGNPLLGNVLGMLAWTGTSNLVQLAPASLAPFTAVCGLAGGLVALAKTDEGVLHIELRKSPLLDPTWPLFGTIVFSGVKGTIQSMAQSNGLLYGFIKGDRNAFFTVAPVDLGLPNVIYYDGEAASAFFPLPGDNQLVVNIPIPIVFYGQHLYAVGESHSNALYAELATGTVSTIPIPKSDTYGLYVDESISRAYGLYHPARGDIMPYNIHADGTLDRTGYDTIDSYFGVGIALDPNLHLLYVDASYNGGLMVFDTVTNQNVTPRRLPDSLGPLFPGGTWADTAHSLLLVAGVSEDKANVGIYQVTVQPQ